MASHYEILGVAADAAPAEIRRAYVARARRWHPDRFVDRSPEDQRNAEAAMRRVNEAWQVLSNSARRSAYDRTQAATTTTARAAGPATTGVRVDHAGVGRIDPRLLDRDYVAARRVAHEAEIGRGRSNAIRVLPWFAILGLLAGIFVFTAYARGDDAPTTTLPSPVPGVEAGDCLRVMTEGQFLTVDCGGPNDGRVIGARLPDGSCPAGTIRQEQAPNGVVICLG